MSFLYQNRERKYPKYSDYIENIVNKCCQKWIILDRRDFRNWRFETFEGNMTELPKGKLIKFSSGTCKSYSCLMCGWKKTNDLMKRIQWIDMTKYRFFTLTLENKYSKENTEMNLQRITKCFNKLNNNMRKKQSQFKNLEYFRVIEIGVDGMVHLHGIWNKYIDIKLLSNMWFKITGDSWVTLPEAIKSREDAVRYLYKYLTKNCSPNYINYNDSDMVDMAELLYESRKRRFQSSRKFFKKKPKYEKKNDNDYLTYGFETEDNYGVENTIKYLVSNFGLKKEHFDLDQYNESDLYLEKLFDSK